MVAVSGILVGTLEAISIVGSVFGAAGAFIIGVWYWSLDHKTAKFDGRLKTDIQTDDSFRGIQRSADRSFITTSNSRVSKLREFGKRAQGVWSDKPDKIVVTKGDTLDQRKIELIRERCREIPGKSFLDSELVAAIRNHYAYKLALSQEDVNSDIVEHFKNQFRSYEHSSRVNELAKTETYREVTLLDHGDENKDALNDIYLPLVEAVEQYRIRPISDVETQHREIENCRGILMLAFFALYARSFKGSEVQTDVQEDEYLNATRVDLRENDNWGYWLLPSEDVEQPEFERFRHLIWCMRDVMNEYWEEDEFSHLRPHGENIQKIDFVKKPFVIFQKDEEKFRGGASPSGQK